MVVYFKNGLVPIHTLITENDKTVIKTEYVSLEESKKAGYHHHDTKKTGKDALQKLLRSVRKDLGSAEYRDMVKANGLSWTESHHDGANTMQATLAAYKFLMEGNDLNVSATGKAVSSKLIGSSQPTEPISQPSEKKSLPTLPPNVKPSKNGFGRLMERLGISTWKEDEGAFLAGKGFLQEEGKYGKLEASAGSVNLSKFGKAPEGQKWGEGNFIWLDSNFNDKEVIKIELEGKYDPSSKKWAVPFRQIFETLKIFKNVRIGRQLFATLKAVVEKMDVEKFDPKRKPVNPMYAVGGLRDSDIDISNFENPEGIKNLTLHDYQKRGAIFMMENKRVVLGLAVGLGKTPSTIVAIRKLINDKKIERALVIAPSSIKYNWKIEIEKFSNLRVCVLEARGVRGRRAKESWREAKKAEVIIVNYEMLRNEDVCETLKKLAPDCVVADESHKLKNEKAQQTAGFRKHWNIAEYKFLLSATPFPNGKAKETHTMLHHVRADRVGSWTNFGRKFVKWEKGKGGFSKAVGLNNLELLKSAMSDIVFMRTHGSPDVEISLPKERHTTFSLEMTEAQKKMYKAVAEDILAEINRMEAMGMNASSPAVIAKLMKLEQVALDPDMLTKNPDEINMNKLYPKEEWAVQTIVDHLENPEETGGVLLFCDKRLPLDKIRQGLINEGVEAEKIAFITGSVKPAERTEIQEKFRKGEVTVLLSTNAGEEGLNLQESCNTLIHLDQVWKPTSISQREGRVLRSGNTSSYVNFFSPIIHDTVEDKKRGTIAKKVEIIELLLGDGAAGSAKNNIASDQNEVSGFTFDEIRNMI